MSRLCEIFVYEPIVKGKRINLHKQKLNKTFNIIIPENKMYTWFDAALQPLKTSDETDLYIKLIELATKCYEKGYSGLDLINYIEHCKDMDELKKYKMLLVFNKIKKDFRNEKLFILFILNFMLLRSNNDLENISFM